MPHLRATAIICAVRPHGEHGAVVRLLTREHGMQAGYVRGGRSRRLRPVLIPGNIVEADLRSRTEDQLAGLTVELVESRGPWLTEPLAASAINWALWLIKWAVPPAPSTSLRPAGERSRSVVKASCRG